MRAFVNTKYTKDETIAIIEGHIQAETLIVGVYWEADTQSGCHVGCLIHGFNYRLFESYFGIDPRVAILCDVIHERLPDHNSRVDFFRRAIPSIPIGADTSEVLHRLEHWMLVDPQYVHLAYDQNKAKIASIAKLDNRISEVDVLSNWSMVSEWITEWVSVWARTRDNFIQHLANKLIELLAKCSVNDEDE